jgi:hypothetical protein
MQLGLFHSCYDFINPLPRQFAEEIGTVANRKPLKRFRFYSDWYTPLKRGVNEIWRLVAQFLGRK